MTMMWTVESKKKKFFCQMWRSFFRENFTEHKKNVHCIIESEK